MNFEHSDDRRMLADSLNRFIAEQVGLGAEAAAFLAGSVEGG